MLNELDESGNDGLYPEAVAHVIKTGRVSVSSIQRQFRLGYNRAARLVERMEAEGIVSGPDSLGARTILKGGV